MGEKGKNAAATLTVNRPVSGVCHYKGKIGGVATVRLTWTSSECRHQGVLAVTAARRVKLLFNISHD